MNNIDEKNIEKIINIRKTVFDEGGEFTVDILNSMPINELEQMLFEHKNKKHVSICQEIKKNVDKLFEDYGDEESNMIALESCVQDCDGGRDLFVDDNPLTEINFAKGYRYNKWVNPIGYELFDKPYTECSDQEKNTRNEFKKMSREIIRLIHEDGVEPIDDFFDHNDSVNQFWHGCYGITRDYKLVSFVIRCDGLLLNNEEPSVIYDFNYSEQ